MPDALPYNQLLSRVIAREDLSLDLAHSAFGQLMDGLWTEAQTGAFLAALAAKGETPSEIAGAALAMRQHVIPIDTHGCDVIDTCGTGGTGLGTFNISTAAALVAAACGAKVAKHGNRTNTRPSGSADVLLALGVNLDAAPDTVARCLDAANICFCYAIKHHPAMKYAVPVRKQLAVRTIFNVLGPLTNPAGAKRQVLGVFDARLTPTLASVLQTLGATRALVVHADDGLDDVSTTCSTSVSELSDGQIRHYRLCPDDFGLQRCGIDALLIRSADESAAAVREVLAGIKGPRRDIVLLNAATALYTAEKAPSIAAALPLTADAVDSGAARETLETLIRASHA